MEKLSKPPMPRKIQASSVRVDHGSECQAEPPRRRVVRPPDTCPDIYSHLLWIGPGTFLVSAYIHKQPLD